MTANVRLIATSLLLLQYVVLAFNSASLADTEKAALLQFWQALTPSSQEKLSWKDDDESSCDWIGVKCERSRVVSLDLSGMGLLGTISPHISSLGALKTLNLSYNHFFSEIPPHVANCTSLTALDLGFNSLHGAIPSEIGNMRNLQYLGLHSNWLSGSIPRGIFQLPSLEYLHLYLNNLTGEIPEFPEACRLKELYLYQNDLSRTLPSSVGFCLQLYDLEVSANRLEGGIPASVGRLSSLLTLFLDQNSLVGSIPNSIGNLTSLVFLDLSQNKLSGEIPPEIGNCKSLQNLFLYKNSVSGAIPATIWQLKNLENLHLFENCLRGHISHDIRNVRKLVTLGLNNNHLNGTIPATIADLPMLEDLNLADNSLSGGIPRRLGQKSKLNTLDLTNNNLTGTVPTGLCHAKRLACLLLGNNRLEGKFPDAIAHCPSLNRATICDNQFSDSIPNHLIQNSRIQYLDMRNNALHGPIPPTLGEWKNLSKLDMSSNHFSGYIPSELGKLSELQYLDLSSNWFTGDIPPELGDCPRLYILNLSRNFLTGNIPDTISKWTQLQHLDLGANNIAGRIPDSISHLQNLIELRLGKNRLEGYVPQALGKLQSLSITLDLSFNQFSGGIPPDLADLKQLMVLDISHNKLSGSIPSQLNEMESLNQVNVSYNLLSGALPTSWKRFLVFSPSSFLGNPGLCKKDDCKQGRNGDRNMKKREVKVLVTAAIVCVAVGISLTGCCLFIWKDRCRHINLLQDLPTGVQNHLRKVPYAEEVIRATDGLSERFVIGKGKHGTVYRAVLPTGELFAVKKIVFTDSRQNEKSFRREVKALINIRHRNLVKIFSFYSCRDWGIIISDYMSNGSLYDLLHKQRTGLVLSWNDRYNIALEIAYGLSYLHHDCSPKIIHRDINTRNILLDSAMVPHVADFGLTTHTDEQGKADVNTSSRVAGTLGYIAPEIGCLSTVTEKSDVYSYGVVLPELLTGKTAIDQFSDEECHIVNWVRSSIQFLGNPAILLDKEIQWEPDTQKDEAAKVLQLAVFCCQDSPDGRPSMIQVVNVLQEMRKEVTWMWTGKEDKVDDAVALATTCYACPTHHV